MDVKCHCSAVSTMVVVAGKFFHLGSQKGDYRKSFCDYKHEPLCLWCGFRFEPIDKAMLKLKK